MSNLPGDGHSDDHSEGLNDEGLDEFGDEAGVADAALQNSIGGDVAGRGSAVRALAPFATAQEIVDRHTHCTVCGAHLHFSHLTDFARNLTQETARCPECGVKARNQTFRLQ